MLIFAMLLILKISSILRYHALHGNKKHINKQTNNLMVLSFDFVGDD